VTSERKPAAVSRPFLAVLSAVVPLQLFIGVAFAEQNETREKEFEDLDRKNFERSSNIDNKWLPLRPGHRSVLTGYTGEGKKRVPHRVVMTVTDLTKVIDGVRAVVVWDLDYRSGKMVESELVFFGQDNQGNVWHLGQYRETYEDGDFVGGQAWLSGLEGARAGIMMKAEPRPNTPSYSEGYAPAPYNWTDRGKVDQISPKVCVPQGCHEQVLVIAEFSKEDGPDAQQLKFYAPGLGNIRVRWRGKGERTQEVLDLVEIAKLGPEEMAKVRSEALALERRAYTYGRTSPAEPMPLAKGQ
jgi:hypothetical protein